MPSDFETQFADSLDGLYDSFGLSATYTSPTGATTTGTVRVQRQDVREVDSPQRSAGDEQSGRVMARQSEFPSVVKGGRFTVESAEVWTVDVTPVRKNGEHVCQCKRTGTERIMPQKG